MMGLDGFDPKMLYPGRPGMLTLNAGLATAELARHAELLTVMNVSDASNEEYARAVRHSLVLLDAEKHKLNYKQSEIDHGIKRLRKKYLGDHGEIRSLGPVTASELQVGQYLKHGMLNVLRITHIFIATDGMYIVLLEDPRSHRRVNYRLLNFDETIEVYEK